MKTTLKLFFAFALVVALTVLSVSAATVDLTLEAYDEASNQYEVYTYYTAEGGLLNTITVKFTFNTEKMLLADGSFTPIDDPTTAANAPIYLPTITVGRNTYKFELPSNSVWTKVDDTKVQGYVTAYTTNGSVFGDTDVQVFSVAFVLADGITPADIAPEDFVIDYIYVADTNLGEFGYNTTADYITQVPEFTNNVVTEVVVDEPETISVAAGSTVYFVDGTAVLYNEDTEVEVPAEAGLIYVNTGYDAHTVYAVDAEGVPTKVTGLDNAILGSAGANIRTSGVQGIRFRASVSNTAKDLGLATSEYEIAEYGFIVTAETNKTGFDSNSDFLGMNLVEAGKAKKGVAYNKADGTDIVFAEETDSTIFTNVVKNIPLTKSALQANIVSRPYYIVTDGETETVLYGELTKKSVYGVAVAIKEAAGADYTDNKDYIDNIISIVEGTQVAELTTEISIDISKLYE